MLRFLLSCFVFLTSEEDACIVRALGKNAPSYLRRPMQGILEVFRLECRYSGAFYGLYSEHQVMFRGREKQHVQISGTNTMQLSIEYAKYSESMSYTIARVRQPLMCLSVLRHPGVVTKCTTRTPKVATGKPCLVIEVKSELTF